MRSIVIFRFFSHLSLLFVYQCITFLPLIFRFSFYNWCYPERRLNTFFAVGEILTDLVSHDFTDPLDVTTEAHTVFLYIDVAQFCDKLV